MLNGLKIENFKNGDLGIRLEEPEKKYVWQWCVDNGDVPKDKGRT